MEEKWLDLNPRGEECPLFHSDPPVRTFPLPSSQALLLALCAPHQHANGGHTWARAQLRDGCILGSLGPEI